MKEEVNLRTSVREKVPEPIPAQAIFDIVFFVTKIFGSSYYERQGFNGCSALFCFPYLPFNNR